MVGNQGAKEGAGAMTVDERIVKALAAIAGDPVENGSYSGRKERYYVFRYTTIGADYADDMPQHERILVYVHFFAPRTFDSTEQVKATKRALHEAGFTWPEVVNESDATGQEIVFECECAEGTDYDAP